MFIQQKSKEPMRLKTFDLDVNILRVNFFHCQSKSHFFKKTKLKLKILFGHKKEKIQI